MTNFAIIDNSGNILHTGTKAECEAEISYFMGKLEIVPFDVQAFFAAVS